LWMPELRQCWSCHRLCLEPESIGTTRARVTMQFVSARPLPSGGARDESALTKLAKVSRPRAPLDSARWAFGILLRCDASTVRPARPPLQRCLQDMLGHVVSVRGCCVMCVCFCVCASVDVLVLHQRRR
jgi:hypothetical protein